MSALEQELIDRIRKLDENQQRQVLLYLDEIKDKPRLSLGEWLRDIEQVSKELEAKYGPHHFPSAADMVNEVRQEAS